MRSIVILLCLMVAWLFTQEAIIYADGANSSVTGSFTVVDEIPPETVTALSVTGQTISSLTLTWTAPGDDGNWGVATRYDVRYSSSQITSEEEWNIAFLAEGEAVPQPAGSTETFTVYGLSPSTTYWFALKTADNVPNWSDLSNSTCGITLSVEVNGGSSGSGMSPASEYLELQLNIFGKVISGQVTEDGVLMETIEAVSPDGMLTLVLPRGTRIVDHEGNPVTRIEVEPTTPPEPPPDTFMVIMAGDFQPSCTFDPPIGLTLRYDPQALADGIGEENLVIAYYDEGQREWVMLPSLVDTEAQTVTASLTHFTILGMLARVPPVTIPIPEVATTPAPEVTPQPAPEAARTPTPEVTMHPVLEAILTLGSNIRGWLGIGISILLFMALIRLRRARKHRHELTTRRA